MAIPVLIWLIAATVYASAQSETPSAELAV